MSDRYSDRYDSYEDEYGSRSNDGYGESRTSRSSYRLSSSYSDASRRRSGDYSTRRLSQSSDARYDASANVFSDYYPESNDIDLYRRSSYGSGAARGSSRRSAEQPGRSDTYYEDGMRSRSSQRVSHTSPTPRTFSERGSERRRYSDSLETGGAYRRASVGSESTRRSAQYERETRGERAYGETDYASKRSNRKRNLIVAAVVVVAVVLIGVGAAFAYVNSISNNLHEGVDDDLKNALVPTNMADEPFYMLLMGTDTAEWRLRDQPEIADTIRSDSMILARIDPVNKKVTLISIGRDTMVDLGEYGVQKINATYPLGGASLTVKAVSELAGVDISHYASVDFDGFEAIVDALGGVEVDVPTAIDDPDAGGSVEAGLQTLDGEHALILCRARHAYDNMNTVGGYVRDGYQRIVLSAIAKKILASDIPTIANTVSEISKYVTTDLDLSDIIGLAQIMQGLDPNTDIYSAATPTEGALIGDAWYEILDETEWAKMIARMDQGLPPSEEFVVDQATGVVLSTTGDKEAAENAAGTYTGERATSTFTGDDVAYWDDSWDDYSDDEYYYEG